MVTYLQLIRWARQTEGALYLTETDKGETGGERMETDDKEREREREGNEKWSWLGRVGPGYGLPPQRKRGTCTTCEGILPTCRINDSHLAKVHEVQSAVASLLLGAKCSPHHFCSTEIGHWPAGGDLVITMSQPCKETHLVPFGAEVLKN